ncbi:MAG TPA: hypothetical protein VL738_28030 [Dactylosporangium sp.]|nr:hypothetical protein [Dactylosporangium sp.]
MKADLDIIKHFAAERLGDAVTAREIRQFVDDNCRAAVEHFGDAIPIIDSNQFAATAAPDVADFGDYTRGWRPEPVDGKPWHSA